MSVGKSGGSAVYCSSALGTAPAVAACSRGGDLRRRSARSSEPTVYVSPSTLDSLVTSVHDDTTTSVSLSVIDTGRYAAGSHRSPSGPMANSCRSALGGHRARQPDLHLAVARGVQRPLAAAVGGVLVERGDAPVVGLRRLHGEQVGVVDVVELVADVDERRDAGAVALAAGLGAVRRC